MSRTEVEPTPIPPLDLAAERAELGPELGEAVQRVLESGAYVLGPVVEGFERDFAAYQRAGYSVGVASGTDALILALRALGLEAGDEVLTSPFTFFASAGSVAWNGLVPKLCDVEPDTGLLDLEQAREAVTDRTRCLLPVHLYGQLVDLRGFRALADERDIPLLEDAAQAHGAERDGLRAGEIGDLASFSFYPTKNLGAAGEGGAILGKDAGLRERLLRLRDHGSEAKYVHVEVGTNSRLPAIQAAVLAVKLPHLEGWNGRRRANAALYAEAFDGSDLVRPLALAPGSTHAYHQYAVRLPAELRDRVQARLAERKIGAALHYPCPVHLQAAAASWGYAPGSLPVAEQLSREVLCLPVHPFLRREEVERVASELLDACRA